MTGIFKSSIRLFRLVQEKMLEKDSKFNYQWLNEISKKIKKTQQDCPCSVCDFCNNIHEKMKLILESFKVSDTFKISVTRYLSYQPYNHYKDFAYDFDRFEMKVLATVDHTLESDRKLIESLHKISLFMKQFIDELNASRNLPELMNQLSIKKE